MTQPAPLVPSEVDLRDYPFMPLDVARLRDSDLITKTTGDEFKAAVMLWCAAWHQLPPGSLPNDEKALAKFAGFGNTPGPGAMRDWKRLRAGALHGFILCTDGRLYHPVVSEKAIEGWNGKLKTRYKRECERIRKAAQRTKTDPMVPSFEEWNSHRLSNGTDHWSPEGQPTPVPQDIPRLSNGTAPPCPTPSPPVVPQKVLLREKGERERDSGYGTVDSGKEQLGVAGGRSELPPDSPPAIPSSDVPEDSAQPTPLEPAVPIGPNWQPDDALVRQRLALAAVAFAPSPAVVVHFVAHWRSKGTAMRPSQWNEEFVGWCIREHRYAERDRAKAKSNGGGLSAADPEAEMKKFIAGAAT